MRLVEIGLCLYPPWTTSANTIVVISSKEGRKVNHTQVKEILDGGVPPYTSPEMEHTWMLDKDHLLLKVVPLV